MPSRSVRRKQHKRLARFETLSSDAERLRRATQLLLAWRTEARQRAEYLGAPAVWALADSPAVQARARRVDPGGELLSELRSVCANAVAEAAGASPNTREPAGCGPASAIQDGEPGWRIGAVRVRLVGE
jgi:hypothetical protein